MGKHRRRRRKSTAARQYPMRNKHHIQTKARGGNSERENILLLKVERHEAWHYLFGQKNIEEIIALLIRVHRLKGRCIYAAMGRNCNLAPCLSKKPKTKTHLKLL
jgi:hypothetical protein